MKVAYTPLGIILALIFIGVPFVVRTVQPVIEGLEQEVEEAAAILGATRKQTFFSCTAACLVSSGADWIFSCICKSTR